MLHGFRAGGGSVYKKTMTDIDDNKTNDPIEFVREVQNKGL